MKIRTLKRLAVSAVGALAALFTTSSAIAATPLAEWFPGNFPDSPSGSSSNNSSTLNGVTLNKNNNGNVFSTTEGLTIGNTGSNGWPALLTGVGQKNTIVVAYKNVATTASGTLIAESKKTDASGQISSLNINSGAWYSGYQQTYNRNSLDVTQPDTDVHVFALAYSNTDGTSYYFDGVHKHTESGLRESNSTIAEVCLGAVRGPSRILSLCTMPYIAVYNSKLSDDEAATAYTRAIAMMNGTEVTRTIAADATVNWSDAAWTIAGTADQEPTFDASTAYKITVTVNGDCTINMPSSIGSFVGCDIKFVLGEGVSSANVTLVYSDTDVTLPTTETAVTTVASPFGTATVTATGATLSYQLGSGLAEGYAATVSGTTMYVSKRPSKGVYSVRIGWRGYNTGSNCGKGDTAGYIDPSYESVGPYPIAGQFWDHTQVWRNNSTSGTFTDIQTLTDAEDGTSTITMGYYGKNSYFNNSNDFGNDFTTPNGILTATYIDDSDSGNGALTATDKDDSSHTINLPAPGHTRGWQLHFEGIPFNAYDVYFITASDQPVADLKETPIYVSLDGGTSWKTYVGDSENQKTVLGTANWKGLPAAQNGVLVEGKNYIKMRITKSLYGDNIGTIDITHGARNTGSYIRSGLAAIQIVEVENDGVYTLTESGKWSDAVWSVGGTSGQTWSDTVDGAASIAKIVSGETVASVEVDQAVSADQVVLTGTSDFAVNGSETLTVSTGFDASEFGGALTLQAPISGTVFIGADTSLQFGGDTDSILPNYTLDGAGAWTKVGTGNLTITNAITLAGVVEAGTVTVSGEGSASLVITNAANVVLSDASAFAGTITPADGATGKTTINGTVLASGSIKTEIWVPAEATLKLGHMYAIGSKGAAPSGKMVGVAGTVDLNGNEGVNAYWLHAGAVLQNTGNNIGANQRQTSQIALYGNATVNAASNFGLLASGYEATSLILNDYTLTKTGDASFWLCHATVSGNEGAGIAVNAGTLYVTPGDQQTIDANLSTVNVPITVGEDATLSINSNSTFAEINGAGTVTSETSATGIVAKVDFSAGLTVSCPVALAEGATIKLGADGATFGGVVTPAGAVTIDCAEIDTTTKTSVSVSYASGSGFTADNITLSNVPENWYLGTIGDTALWIYHAVATITKDEVTTAYGTMEAALADAVSGDTIVLLESIEGDVTLPEGVMLDVGEFTTGTVSGADGCVVTKSGNVYTSALGVAKVGTTGYATITNALAAVTDGGTVTLLQDISVNKFIYYGKGYTLDLNGHKITGSTGNYALFYVYKGKTVTLTDTSDGATGSVESNKYIGLTNGEGATLNVVAGSYRSTAGSAFATSKGAASQTINISGGTIQAREMCVLAYSAGATINVTGGTLTSDDNAVIGDNGTSGLSGNTINLSGCTLNGNIVSDGYVACGVYIANDNTVNISNVTMNITGGCGVCQRAGVLTISDDTVITTSGNVTGKVGDSRIVVPCSAIVYDSAANYPGYDEATTGANIEGGTFTSAEGVNAITQVTEEGDAVEISVSGGAFSTVVADEFCAEGFVPVTEPNADGKYVVEAGWVVTFIDEKNATSNTVTVAKNATVSKPETDPTFEGFTFEGWYNGETAYDFTAAVTANLTLTAKWTEAASTFTVTVLPAENTMYGVLTNLYPMTAGLVAEDKAFTIAAGSSVGVWAFPIDAGYVFDMDNLPEGWADGSSYEAGSVVYTIESLAADTEVTIPGVVAKPSGYNNGADGTFTIAAEKETALKAKLPEGKSLGDAISTTSSLTYAQAYALGLWDENATEVKSLDATITVANGKVTVSLANAPADGYTITTKVYAKDSLADAWPTEPSTGTTFDAGTAGFYKVAVVISNTATN